MNGRLGSCARSNVDNIVTRKNAMMARLSYMIIIALRAWNL